MAVFLVINNIFRFRNAWFLFAAALFLCSCSKKATDNGEHSEKFKVLLADMTSLNNPRTPDEDQRYLDSAFRTIQHPHFYDIYRFYGFKYTYYKKHAYNPKKEVLYADSMLIIAKKMMNSSQYAARYAEANFDLGDAYFELSQFSNAYECYYQGYFMGKNTLKNDILSEYTYRMGMVMFRQAHYDKAVDFFKLSYEQSLSNEDNFPAFNQRQEVIDNIGESYRNTGNIDSAAFYFGKTLRYIDENSMRFSDHSRFLESARAVVYGNQGEVEMTRGHYQQAEQLLQKSIELNLKKGNDQSNAELVEINLGKLYLNNHQLQSFITLFHNLRNQLDSVKNEEAETSWNWLMSKYYLQKNDPSKAYRHLLAYTSLRDSAVKRSTTLKETDVNQQQANYDKQYQIESLTENNRVQVLYTYAAASLTIMAGIIFALVYRDWKRSKREIKVVNELNKQVSVQKTGLETTLNELKLSIQEKDRILRAVAHDLRNPIGGITSLTQVMLNEAVTEEQKEIINLIHETSHNSLELINEILEVADSGASALNKELVEINALVGHSVELLNFKAAEKNQAIRLKLLKEPVQLLISREKIWRVVGNLISNAIKFSPAGEIIDVEIADQDNEVEISFKDSGIGIPDGVKDKVFNIFTEAKRPGTAGEKSFGLGLSICRQIIENHNGKIWFESAEGKGTTFYITLPKPTTGEISLSENPHTNSRTI
ncbi:MAG: tetratricopeptide repeat-containing sensor histidine kinase [Mucilaginibacter sp.]